MSVTPIEQERLLSYGSPEPASERLFLRAGYFEMEFSEGQLRHIREKTHEPVQRIYFAARDAAWCTAPNSITVTRCDIQEKEFSIDYRAESVLGNLHLAWQAELRGTLDSTISFKVKVHVLRDCASNRIGLCTLIPQGIAGLSGIVIHSDKVITDSTGHPVPGMVEESSMLTRRDGTVEEWVRFLKLVAPHQPITDIKSIRYRTLLYGRYVTAEFHGDVFEMEDQRNWSDASFKIYSGQLGPAHPLPVQYKAGTCIEQQVIIRREYEMGMLFAPPRKSYLDFDESKSHPLPALGVTIPLYDACRYAHVAPALDELRLSHLRLELTPDRAPNEFDRYILQNCTTPIEAALTFSAIELKGLESWLEHIAGLEPRLARWLCYGVPNVQLPAVCDTLRRLFPGVPVGAGSNENLAELNRNHPDVRALDLLTCALNPQVHQFDNDNLINNLGSHRSIADTMQAIAPDKPLVFSPVTLKPRFIPVAGQPKRLPRIDELELLADDRQVSLLGAIWLVSAISNLAASEGVSSITAYNAWGWGGIMHAPGSAAFTSRWPFLEGAFFPSYQVLRWLGKRRGAAIIPTPQRPFLRFKDTMRRASALVLKQADLIHAIACNLSGEPQSVMLDLPGDGYMHRLLHPGNVADSLHRPDFIESMEPVPLERYNEYNRFFNEHHEYIRLELPAWGIAFIEQTRT